MFVHKNLDSYDFWQLFRDLKKERETGFASCGAFCPLFVSIEVKNVVMAQGFVSLSFKTINENNVQ